MKETDFIVGKWYKSKWDNYFKFKGFKDGYFYSSEDIIDKIWMGGGRLVGGWGGVGWGSFGLWMEETFLSEIQEYLPTDHPDRIINIVEEHIDDLEPLMKLLNKIENNV